MDHKHFEKIVREGIRAIPEKFLRLLQNVAITIEEAPSPRHRKHMRLRSDETLFGLYEGVPQTERGVEYSGVLPDKITIFKQPILEASKNEDEIREIVRDTVWHEIAHHFGMEERWVRRAERKRRKRKHCV